LLKVRSARSTVRIKKNNKDAATIRKEKTTMSEFNDELLTNQLIDIAFRTFQREGVRLTDQAGRFIRLAAEALIKDPPKSTNPQQFPLENYGPGGQGWLEIGQTIINEAWRDQRISNDMTRYERVSFPTIVRVLSDITDALLSRIGFKGI
jgi:hypothetical protein